MDASREFVYEKFASYYRDPSTVIPETSFPENREFAYLMFKERFMVRHKRFAEFNNFKSALAETVPADVFHSCAYYENPDFDMDKKGWMGADLVFDIDSDHIPTNCDKIHDEFTCNKCGFNGRGLIPEVCPCCGATKFDVKTWPCELCIQSARYQTSNLIDLLENDFGFSQNELHVFFSGHRGYHIHIENEVVRSLDTIARKEIADYVTGIGLDITNKKSEKKSGKRFARKKFFLHNFGWNRRLKVGMRNFLLNATKEDIKKAGLRNNALIKNKEIIIKRCITESRWESINDVSVQTWLKLAEYVKELQSSKIDTVVTTDIHRLIRMNCTLHGKTGLKKVEFSAKTLEDFDPFTAAVAFKKGEVKVLVSDAPMFRLGEKILGPYKKQIVELPVAAAVMLICKGRAEVTN